MRIVVDTNIVFSAIVNTNGKIARILFQPKSRLNFYTPHLLLDELSVHRSKLGSISGLEEQELDQIIQLITRRIRFINLRLIPSETFQKAENLTRDFDIDDTEFVALAEHAKAKLWTGDKRLIQGLRRKGWNKVLSTEDLLASFTKK